MGGNKNWDGAVAGMTQAAQHANDVRAGWDGDALTFFVGLAMLKKKTCERFLTEDVVQVAEEQGLFAPDNRAWGFVAQRAKRLGVVKSAGLGYSKKGAGNAAPRTIWEAI